MGKTLSRIIGVVGGIALLGVLLGACGSSPATSSKEPTVVIGYENNGADPEMVAIAEGFFAKDMKGVHVELREFSSGPASLAALASGSLQFMTGIGNPPAAAAISQGVPLQAVWAQELYTTDEGLVVRNGSGINSLKDLEHKQLAIVVGSTSPFEVDTAFRNAGIPASSVAFVNMSPPAMVAAWARGQLNAAYVWDPAFDTMLKNHGHAIMYDRNVERQAPIFNLAVVNSNWAKSNATLVREFVQAEQAGVTFYRQHPQRALKDMAKEAGIRVALAQTELAGFRLYNLQDQLGPDGLGTGSGVKDSLVTVALRSAATYLLSIHQVSSIPQDMSIHVNPAYAQYVAHHQ
ncbi:MAG: ABC transporter substrate-binding protein [Thermaerobacter sp.]|nr:ABC transporter substrate-binding protein [Thermaerobacter sp.]